MKITLLAENTYLCFPIKAECPEKKLSIFVGDKKCFEFMIPDSPEADPEYDYVTYLNIGKLAGQELTLVGDFGEAFYRHLTQTDHVGKNPVKRPLLHFTADHGWINDPNGMVYHNGTYHLFFQYNPFNTKWENMSWGHSVSTDLVHFEQRDTALYPDETGVMYSGCGLVNERGLLGLPKDALLFYYSAAGNISEWSRGIQFTQRLAYSLDEGETLVKHPEVMVDVLAAETRDPKIFWHEETESYIMMLFIEGNEFAILRSADLKNWEETQRFVLPEAWECPDLFALNYEGKQQWIFMSADGFYYLGDFDGYQFVTDGVQRLAYATKLPYAAQSYSGIEGRTVAIPWMRTLNPGKIYTGMMGIPRELTLVNVAGIPTLAMNPVREYLELRKEKTTFSLSGETCAEDFQEENVVHISLEGAESADLCIFGKELTISEKQICFGDQTVALSQPLTDLQIIVDREILELYGNGGTVNAYFETDLQDLMGAISVKAEEGTVSFYTCK